VFNITNLRAQPMPTNMTIRQTARPTNEIETIRRTATKKINHCSASGSRTYAENVSVYK